MKQQQHQSITNLPLSPDEERRHRMIKYSVAMGVRVLCIIVDPVRARAGGQSSRLIGAVFLPYFAVVDRERREPTRVKRTFSVQAISFP